MSSRVVPTTEGLEDQGLSVLAASPAQVTTSPRVMTPLAPISASPRAPPSIQPPVQASTRPTTVTSTDATFSPSRSAGSAPSGSAPSRRVSTPTTLTASATYTNGNGSNTTVNGADSKLNVTTGSGVPTDTSDQTTLITAIVLLTVGIAAITTAGVVAFVWRRRRGRESVPATFVTYMRHGRHGRPGDDDISITSSWHDGCTWHDLGQGTGGANLWRHSAIDLAGDMYPSYGAQHQQWAMPGSQDQQDSQYQGSSFVSGSYPIAAQYQLPHADKRAEKRTHTLWRKTSRKHVSASLDFIPYRGPVEKPTLIYPCNAAWLNRPLPPLPAETQALAHRLSANRLGLKFSKTNAYPASQAEHGHASFTAFPGFAFSSQTPPSTSSSATPSSELSPPSNSRHSFYRRRSTIFSFDAARHSSPFHFDSALPSPSLSLVSGPRNSMPRLSHPPTSATPLSARIHDTSRTAPDGHVASVISDRSFLSRHSHASSASTAAVVTGFAFNARRSAATMLPSDAVPSTFPSRATTPILLDRTRSYRYLTQKRSNTLPTLKVLRRHSTTKSSRSVRFAKARAQQVPDRLERNPASAPPSAADPVQTTPYPFGGFGSGTVTTAHASLTSLRRVHSQPDQLYKLEGVKL